MCLSVILFILFILLILISDLQVQDTSFILCIVYVQPEIPVKQLKNLNTAPSSKLLYHRLDLLGQPSSCLHFKQLATVGKLRQNINIILTSWKKKIVHAIRNVVRTYHAELVSQKTERDIYFKIFLFL